MRRNAILFSLSIIVLTILSCDENKPEEITSEISINNTVSPIKLIEGVTYKNETSPNDYKTPPYSLLIIGENDIALVFSIYNKKEDKLPTGVYTIDEERKQNDLTIFGSIGEVYHNNKSSVKTRSIDENDNDENSIIITNSRIIKQGNMEISTKNQHYIIRFEGIDEEEKRVSFTYQGELTITNVELKDR